MMWLTIGLLVLCGLLLVVAAFWDRRRGREIQRDLKDQARRRREE